MQLAGNVLYGSQHVENSHELAQMIEGMYFVLPLRLDVSFPNPPYVERVEGL